MGPGARTIALWSVFSSLRMVDSFCSRFLASMNYREAVEEWNVLQAGSSLFGSQRLGGQESFKLLWLVVRCSPVPGGESPPIS